MIPFSIKYLKKYNNVLYIVMHGGALDTPPSLRFLSYKLWLLKYFFLKYEDVF